MPEQAIGVIKRCVPEEYIKTDEPLSAHTTFRIGGPADIYIQLPSVTALIDIMRACAEHGLPFTLLGGGSNVLISDNGLRGVTAQTQPGLNNIAIDNNLITAEAGETLAELAQAACRAGLSGLEFASGIPGTVGGAVYMNAGAYERSIADVFVSARVYMPKTDEITVINAGQMDFGYRRSVLQDNGGVVLDAVFKLTDGEPCAIREHMRGLNAKRVSSQPLNMPSAGSVFKRPEGFFAGKLISDCGLRGYSVGGARVSEKHAGFIVNAGGASADDVIKLIEHIRETVFAACGVTLEPEIRMLGEF